MLLFDLRVVLFVILIALVLTALAAIWLDRRLARNRSHQITADVSSSSESHLRPLLNDLAHELRTPLAVLLTHLEIQRRVTVPLETKQESIRLMQAETRRMSQMVSNLLELGELETQGLTARRPVNLRPLVTDVLAEMMPRANENSMTLTLDADGMEYWVNGDEFRLKQVFLNLVDNSLKYARAQDHVQITLERKDTTRQVLCAVCDTGLGIAAEHLPHLTRRFYRGASDEIGGSGLGLALVAAILQLHDSVLEIESKTEGRETGTCVRFALPISMQMEDDK